MVPSTTLKGHVTLFSHVLDSFDNNGFFKKFYLFIWQRERKKKWAQAEAGWWGGRQREKEKQILAEQGAQCGARSQHLGIMTRAEGSCLTNWATQAPLKISFLKWSIVDTWCDSSFRCTTVTQQPYTLCSAHKCSCHPSLYNAIVISLTILPVLCLLCL